MIRRNYSYLRYSSGIEGCEPADMIMMAVCQSMWHAVGERIGRVRALSGPCGADWWLWSFRRLWVAAANYFPRK